VWKWKEESGGTINPKLRRLGASPDWSRERFTMDPGLAAAVRRVFVQLYREGLIIRDKRLVTGIGDAHRDFGSRGPESRDQWLAVVHSLPRGGASGVRHRRHTRPETMLGDPCRRTPNDPRFADLVGKSARLPLADRLIPIVADEHADPETRQWRGQDHSAHDFCRFRGRSAARSGAAHIFDEDARLKRRGAGALSGLDRLPRAKRWSADLAAAGFLKKVEDHTLMSLIHDRSGEVIEPWLTDNGIATPECWAGPALAAVEDGRTRFVRPNGEHVLRLDA